MATNRSTAATRHGRARAAERIDADEAQRLEVALGRVNRRIRARTSSGLTPSQLSCLVSIVREGPLRASRLASLDAINPTALSRIINRLEEDGLVSRTSDPDDGRALALVATRKGRRLIDHVKADRRALVVASMDGLAPEHTRALVAALPALEALAARLADPDPAPGSGA